jgi:hypothetical protein
MAVTVPYLYFFILNFKLCYSTLVAMHRLHSLVLPSMLLVFITFHPLASIYILVASRFSLAIHPVFINALFRGIFFGLPDCITAAEPHSELSHTFELTAGQSTTIKNYNHGTENTFIS